MPVRKLHIANQAGRDATVAMETAKSPKGAKLGHPELELEFRQFLAAGPDGLHDTLSDKLGEDYGQALIDGDPDVDTELVGRSLGRTSPVYLSSTGEVLYATPSVVEVIFAPNGEERDRRAPTDTEANVNDQLPVRWTGRAMPRRDVARRFAFKRTIQLKHVDGLTYDYLYAMAKELGDKDEVVLIGGGPKGRQPLVFQINGTPYRGFLEGRVQGDKYKLLLHLSNLELKTPEEA
ncbi:MAG: hypothetical protein EP330_19380 [Deltaproteobacteria bacterium]|nr:MAG: hypothetical protein EP330_19380 [Deltaproteobacteria bacterium]